VHKCLWYRYVNLITTKVLAVMRVKRIKILILAQWLLKGDQKPFHFQGSTFRIFDLPISELILNWFMWYNYEHKRKESLTLKLRKSFCDNLLRMWIIKKKKKKQVMRNYNNWSSRNSERLLKSFTWNNTAIASVLTV